MAFDPKRDYLLPLAVKLDELATADPSEVDVHAYYDAFDEWDRCLGWLESVGGGEWVPRLHASEDAAERYVRYFDWQWKQTPPMNADEQQDMARHWGRIAERLQWFAELIRRASALESFHPSKRQADILKWLTCRAMKTEERMAALDCERATLFGNKTKSNSDGRGGLRELRELGLVDNDRKLGVFCRPDKPPEQKPEQLN